MIEKVGLRGDDLLAFALIHGCTQKGEGCWHGGYDKLSQRIGASKRNAFNVVERLEERRMVEKFDAVIDGQSKKAIRSIVDSEKIADANFADEKNADEKFSPKECKIFTPDSEKISSSNKVNRKDSNIYPEAVERIYKLYPTRCPKRDVSTNKSSKCKDKLVKLLKTHTEEELTTTINRYVHENYGKNYLKDFATLLNNLPDYSEQELPLEQPKPQLAVLHRRSPEELARDAFAKHQTIIRNVRQAIDIIWNGSIPKERIDAALVAAGYDLSQE